MKSGKYQRHYGGRHPDILKSATERQLAWLGAAVLAYNDAEDWLQLAFIQCFDYPARHRLISGAISVGALPNLIYEAVVCLGLPSPTVVMADQALRSEGFTQLKTYRDGIAHARLFDMTDAIGTRPNKGDPDWVLLTDDALEGLYHRLVLVGHELQHLGTVIACKRDLKSLEAETLAYGVQHDPNREPLESAIQAATDQLAQLQTQRKRLPPLPAFPVEGQSVGLAPQKRGALLQPTK